MIDITSDEKLLKSLLADENISIEDALENEMVINMGPQHPATHGVLRLVLRLDGETVVKVVPELGYLHRGYEKMAEGMTYYEYIPHTDRLDYTATMANNVAYTLAVENLAGIQAPKRAQYIRMIVAELARIMGHLVAIGTFAMDVGAVTMVLWTFREREVIQDIFDRVAGARFTTSYTRIGGVASDMDDQAIKMTEEALVLISTRVEEYEKLLNSNRIFVERLEGVGVLSKEDAIRYGVTGPNLRGSGVDYDVRRSKPYLYYNEIDFNVPVYNEGDSLARYFVRVDEVRESIKIIRQCIAQMPKGPIIANEAKKVLPHKDEIYSKMEELIHDFMLVNFGINPPVGDSFFSVENPKGELGFYIVSNGKGYPWKLKIRSPSFCNLQVIPLICKGHFISDVVAIIGSLDPVMGEADK
ncbi:MAG: NADH dehydrogenase (quinone) subunit D [Melioribacteraceae bacterium]|nr:NADH dehydrogenase (quinone) subunit D [Melioribacteraceae bacterium]MCF8355328.1 NADH dehydrogenase (quinone) subunit D [Melioribacteraceae bacterium]MCF8396337.1 NADH dehydrogenase (quinone) subunit D [Melioribacteraceae bacterium]MCF8420406.1 NADH dehydrogenase (quinone) subunit D [Melioribacteraceae bacterium]